MSYIALSQDQHSGANPPREHPSSVRTDANSLCAVMLVLRVCNDDLFSSYEFCSSLATLT